MKKWVLASIVLLVGLITWVAFWFRAGRDLTYDVESNGVYRYTEDFSTQGKMIITTLVALAAAAIASIVVHMCYCLWKLDRR